MRAFVGESLTALYSKCFYSWRIEAGLCFHWNRRHPKEKYTKIVPLESSAVFHNISLFGSSFIFVSPHPQFPSHPGVILHEPFVAGVLRNKIHMRRQRWVCVVFLTYTRPLSSVTGKITPRLFWNVWTGTAFFTLLLIFDRCSGEAHVHINQRHMCSLCWAEQQY